MKFRFRYLLIRLVALCKPVLVPATHELNSILRRLVTASHGLEFRLRWHTGPNIPEWFDHYLDMYWAWPATGNAIFFERGALGHFAIARGDRVLDICCGDGFYPRYFWSPRAREVVGIDLDQEALAHARRHNSTNNITYVHGNILEGLPSGPFNVVVWNAAIEHFHEDEIRAVLRNVKAALTDDGVLVGTTIVQGEEGQYVWHKREFRDQRDLADFLLGEFAHVTVVRSPHASRTELLFYASETQTRLPFSGNNDANLVVDKIQENLP